MRLRRLLLGGTVGRATSSYMIEVVFGVKKCHLISTQSLEDLYFDSLPLLCHVRVQGSAIVNSVVHVDV